MFKSLAIATAAAATLLVGMSAHAMPIFNFSKVTSAADVINTGNILRATNLGFSGQNTSSPVTVNGVSFDNNTAGLSGLTPGGGDFNVEAAFNGTNLGYMLSGTYYARADLRR
ncbi:MAG: hypothetical protein HOI95_05970 [Chromatiales bacterium]|jgi:hypothetical protein|nr:hypothetical protein [Chromatiales bacterium]